MKEGVDFAGALHLAVKALQFYSPDHPRAAEALAVLEQAAQALLGSRGRVLLTATKGALLIDGEPLVSSTAHVKNLAVDLERREIGGIVLMEGVTARELLELVRAMGMRPEQIRTAGGVGELLRRADVTRVRISNVRYEAVTEGEEVVWGKNVRRDVPQEDAAESLPALLRQYLLANLRPSAGGGGAAAADRPSFDAAFGEQQGEGLLRAAMQDVDPIAQLAILISLRRMPQGQASESIRTAGNTVLAGLATSGGASGGENDPMRALLNAVANSDEQLGLLRQRLEQMGVTREQFDELLDILLWDKLTFDQRLEKLLDGGRLFDLPADKLQRFVRELLMAARHADVQRLLERYVTGLEHESVVIRHAVCETLGQVALNIKQPGLTREVEQLVGSSILNQFVREKDARMKGVLGDAAATFITMLVATGRSEPALRVLARLDAAVAAAPEGAAVRLSSESLMRALGEPPRAAELVEQICAADAESLARWSLPLATRLGATIAPHLIDALGNEEDRNRRGRLVKALKTIGEPAYPFLVDALAAPVWYVVRNALNVLGDIGTEAQVEPIGRRLGHGDARVRRAAARALGKIGGSEAEGLLVGALEDRDAELQTEVLLCLGAMKARSAVTGVSELAKSRLRTDEKVRELAVTTLGQIGSDDVVPVLSEILRPRMFFGRENPAVRLAAAKALASIATSAAKDALRSAHAAETDRATKAMLAKLV